MSWQYEVGSGSNRATDYRDLLSKWMALATSQKVATVAVNSGGSGYTVGDILTLTHAGAVLDARFEVTSESSGVITGLAIRSSGAFSNRLASATVAAGGSGYAVGDILEVQGGTETEKAKVQVATLSGSAVATVTAFQNGGAYTSAPGAGSSTVGRGPAAFAGDDACTLNPTMTGLIGTTGLSVTGGTGSSATVDITLSATGWEVVSALHNRTENGLTDEMEVVMRGASAGNTNKPYVGFITATFTSGINTRYAIAMFGMAAFNASIGFHEQVKISPGINVSTGALQTPGAFFLCDEDAAQSMDFWMSVNDSRMIMLANINSGAVSTDNGEYIQGYAGYLNRFGTETEDPYPLFVGASARTPNIDPSAGSQHVTGFVECVAPTGAGSGFNFYDTNSAAWVNVHNSQNLQTNQLRPNIMYPMGQINEISDNDATKITDNGPIQHWTGYGSTGRASPSRVLYPVPGSASDLQYLRPLIVIRRLTTSLDEDNDRLVGQMSDLYWVHATDNTGAKITNFSEDIITEGSNRYTVFHNHVQTERYQFVAVLEDY